MEAAAHQVSFTIMITLASARSASQGETAKVSAISSLSISMTHFHFVENWTSLRRLTLLLPRVPKIKIQDKSQISYCKILNSK